MDESPAIEAPAAAHRPPAPSGTMDAVPSSAPTARGPRTGVSACIIARDEEQRLAACLASVAFCDEMVVVDSGSLDATAAIARAAGRPRGRAAVARLRRAAQRRHRPRPRRLDPRGRRRRARDPASCARDRGVPRRAPDGVDSAACPARPVPRRPARPLGQVPEVPATACSGAVATATTRRARSTRACGRSGRPRAPFDGDLAPRGRRPGRGVRDAWRYARLEAGQLAGAAIGARARHRRGRLPRREARLPPGGRRRLARRLARAAPRSARLRRRRAGLGPPRAAAQGRRSAAGSRRPGRASTSARGATRLGSVRVVAVAGSDAAARRAAAWASCAAARGGADVALLVTGAPPGAARGCALRVAVGRAGRCPRSRAPSPPRSSCARVDVVVAFGRRASVALRVLPPAAGAAARSTGTRIDRRARRASAALAERERDAA